MESGLVVVPGSTALLLRSYADYSAPLQIVECLPFVVEHSAVNLILFLMFVPWDWVRRYNEWGSDSEEKWVVCKYLSGPLTSFAAVPSRVPRLVSCVIMNDVKSKLGSLIIATLKRHVQAALRVEKN